MKPCLMFGSFSAAITWFRFKSVCWARPTKWTSTRVRVSAALGSLNKRACMDWKARSWRTRGKPCKRNVVCCNWSRKNLSGPRIYRDLFTKIHPCDSPEERFSTPRKREEWINVLQHFDILWCGPVSLMSSYKNTIDNEEKCQAQPPPTSHWTCPVNILAYQKDMLWLFWNHLQCAPSSKGHHEH